MFLHDLLFPRVCLGCGFLGVDICRGCCGRIVRVVKQKCFYCGHLSVLGLTHPGCNTKNGIDGFLIAFYYNNTLRSIIGNFKYRLVRSAVSEIVNLISAETIAALKKYKTINNKVFFQPVPLHNSRLRARGFNQSELIANHLTESTAIPISDLLVRQIPTLPQAKLQSRNIRQKNMRGAFAIIPNTNIAGKVFILVDDVVTTGSTTNEAARVLKLGGALRVYVFALAKG